MSRKIIFPLIVGTLILLIYFVSSPKIRPDNQLVLGCPKNICLLPLIAKNQGYFEAHGLNVKIRKLLTGKITMDSLLAKDIDLGTLVDSNIALAGYQPDTPLRVIASLAKRGDNALLARADRGIKSASDLKGKSIGYLPGTSSHIYLARFLEINNIAWHEISPVVMKPPVMQAAIINGDVDAVSFWQPWRSNAVKALDGNYIEFENTFYSGAVVLATHQKTIDHSSDKLVRFLAALEDAEQFIATHLDETLTILSKEINIEREVLSKTWHQFNPSLGFTSSAANIIIADAVWIRQTQKAYFDKELPDYKKLFKPEFLLKLSPERVTLDVK